MARTQPSQRLRPEIEAELSAEHRGFLASRAALWSLLLVVAAGVAIYVWCAFSVYRVQRLADTRDPAALLRAETLQPRDASVRDLLGQYYMWDGQDFHGAASQFQAATHLNPYNSAYWLHLAEADATLGNDSGQQAAVRQALLVDPTTPEIAWHAANLSLLQGQTAEALDRLAVVVRNDPSMADAALDLSWRASQNLAEIERRLPNDPAAYLKLLKVLVNREQWDSARSVWSSLMRMPAASEPLPALFYVDALLERRDVAGAKSAWQDLLRKYPSLQSYEHANNLVVDGAFEHDILNAGFDWRYRETPDASVQVDTAQSHQGTQSILITYSGPSEDVGLFQYVPVTPGETFVASAWAMSEELESANGPRLSIADPYANVEYGHSQETLGTTSWHPLSVKFTAGPNTNLVAIRFSREPGSTRIKGKFWIDTVSVSKSGSESVE